MTATGDTQLIRLSLSEGSHKVRIAARDSAGNVSDWVSRSFLIDATAPAKAVVGLSRPTPDQIDSTFTVKGEAGSAFRLLIQPGNTLREGRLDSGLAEVTERLRNGSYSVTATLTDASGNASKPVTHKFAINIPAPAVPVIQAVASASSAGMNVSASGPPYGSVLLRKADGQEVGRISLDSIGRGSQALRLESGNHEITAVAIDFQGQESAATTFTARVERAASMLKKEADATPLETLAGLGIVTALGFYGVRRWRRRRSA